MISLRCSQLDQIAACPASAIAPDIRIESDSQPARMGTGIHRLMSQKVSGADVDVAATAKALDLDGDELGMAFGMTWNAWKSVEEWFPLPEVDFEMPIFREEYGDNEQQATLTGTADVRSLIPGRKLIRIADFKTGFLDRSCENQLKGYAWLDIDAAESEDIGGDGEWRVQTVAIRPRSGTVEISDEMSYAELRAWWQSIENSVVRNSQIYRPSPTACRYCRRAHECPARQQLARNAVALVMEPVTMAESAIATNDNKAAILQMARFLESACKDAIEFVRAEVAVAGGSLPLSDGRTLQLTEQKRRKIDPVPAWKILSKHLGDRLPEALSVSKTTAEKIVGDSVSKGKGKAKAAFVEELDKAGALETETVERLEIVRAAAQITTTEGSEA